MQKTGAGAVCHGDATCPLLIWSVRLSILGLFRNGAKITDIFGFLEGSGKGRRHVKLMSVAQIKDKKLAQYLSLALQASKQDDS